MKYKKILPGTIGYHKLKNKLLQEFFNYAEK